MPRQRKARLVRQSRDNVSENDSRPALQAVQIGSKSDKCPTDSEDKLRQLGMLTGKVAHELCNPLSTIHNSLHVIERQARPGDLKLEAAIERIRAAVCRSNRLVTELLDFAKANQLSKDVIPCDLWLSRILAEQAQYLPNAIKLDFDLAAGDAAIAFDAYKMEASISNLINNAAEALVGKDYNPFNNFRSDPLIRVSSTLAERGLEISVYNNGPKIEEANLEKILTPLYTTKSFGTGLGLSVVQDILLQHGGGLEIENGADTGVTFTAWIPTDAERGAETARVRTGSIMCGLA